MKEILQPVLAGGALALALSACGSTGSIDDHTRGSSSTGATASSAVEGDDRPGLNSAGNPQPAAGNSSTGNVIDDRINNNTNVPDTNR